MASLARRQEAIRHASEQVRSGSLFVRPAYEHSGCKDCDGYGTRHVLGWENNGHGQQVRCRISAKCETCNGKLQPFGAAISNG